ncbi:MAG: UDP-N-acetylglucosamine 2-epimerase (non-hydrolyzing) [Desulfobulbaceae bacterium]|nr:UDP-N-acetylglucosamine 2-epimerase (non-hydrolyzing) [Desulfobulbaceae bacterium]
MKILSLFGTRPEAIKMAPIVKALEDDPFFTSILCVTAQHRQMLDQVLNLFSLSPDYDLNIMKDNQDLFDITSKVLLGVRDVLKKEKPDMILVHGDTTTCLAGALAGFYSQIPVGHVEAGLRTGNLSAPFPEEANRQITSRITTLHFSPTEKARENLLKEQIPSSSIYVTGNSVIDALLWVREKVAIRNKWPDVFGSATAIFKQRRPYVLITGHRRENIGAGFQNICAAISTIAEQNPEINFVYPVHLNPNVQQTVYRLLCAQKNIHLIPPLDYEPFVYAMDRCLFILTDSGGVQEEAPSLGKPVLVMRDTTERPEAVAAGTVVLVGTNKKKIIDETSKLLKDPAYYRQMSTSHNPYGDGNATKRILHALKHYPGGSRGVDRICGRVATNCTGEAQDF